MFCFHSMSQMLSSFSAFGSANRSSVAVFRSSSSNFGHRRVLGPPAELVADPPARHVHQPHFERPGLRVVAVFPALLGDGRIVSCTDVDRFFVPQPALQPHAVNQPPVGAGEIRPTTSDPPSSPAARSGSCASSGRYPATRVVERRYCHGGAVRHGPSVNLFHGSCPRLTADTRPGGALQTPPLSPPQFPGKGLVPLLEIGAHFPPALGSSAPGTGRHSAADPLPPPCSRS